jgi:hypothetical protein
MVGALPVQTPEVPAIVRQHGSTQNMCAGQDVRIGSCRALVFLGSHNIMPEPSQFLDDRKGKIGSPSNQLISCFGPSEPIQYAQAKMGEICHAEGPP